MRLSHSLATKALEVARHAYDRPTFTSDDKKDDFYTEVDSENRILWIGIAGSNDRHDWFDNFLAFGGWFLGVVRAHKRWFKRTQGFQEKLDDLISHYENYSVVVAGHSYGGAGAQNYTLLNPGVHLCITFNSPKPWKKFKDGPAELLMREKCHHFINEGDKVPSVPFRNRIFGREYRKAVKRFGLEHTYWKGLQQIIDWYLR